LFWGLAEKVDTGNRDPNDQAFVFSDLIGPAATADAYGRELAAVAAHETGHLLGFAHNDGHAAPGAASGPLDDVAWKPYTHIEVGKDVYNDVVDDGKLILDGQDYDVNPRIVEALRRFPSYYLGGNVGPDGFPDVVMGQAVIHPTSTGLWVSHVLDYAWKAQIDDTYSESEKLQILAWAYGFASHAAEDSIGHTFVNEFADGIYPSYLHVVLPQNQGAATAIRHLLAEAYINDATPGFDGVKELSAGPGTLSDSVQRVRLPDGDVSDNSTPAEPLNTPDRFIYDALINNLPDLPGEDETLVGRDASPSGTVLDATNATPIVITALPTLPTDPQLHTGDQVTITDVKGNTTANGTFTVTVLTQFPFLTFSLNGSKGNENYPFLSGGSWQKFNPFTAPAGAGDTTVAFWKQQFQTRFANASDVNPLSDAPTVTVIDPGKILQIKNDYTYYTARIEPNQPVWDVYQVGKTRGPVIDLFIGLRDKLVAVQSGFEQQGQFPDLNPPEPLQVPVDDLIKGITDLLHGKSVNTDELIDDFKNVASKFIDAAKNIVGTLLNGNGGLTTAALRSFVTLFSAALGMTPVTFAHYWINNIDTGLQHWAEVGLSMSRAFFDPQAKRDVQNDEGKSDGPDLADTPGVRGFTGTPDMVDSRADTESGIGVFDVWGSLLQDSGFIDNFLLPMVGVPRKIGDLHKAVTDAIDQVQEKILDPVHELLGSLDPIKPLIDYFKFYLKEVVENFIFGVIKSWTGIDAKLVDYLLNTPLPGKMDIKSITIAGEVIPIFAPTDHERLDVYMGVEGSDHHLPLPANFAPNQQDEVHLTDNSVVDVTFYGDLTGPLKPDVEFNKQTFAAYADSVTLAKMLLLQETLPNGEAPVDGKQPKVISQLLSKLTGQPYDFAQMTLIGNHGGDVLTATMPGVTDPYGQPVAATSNLAPGVFNSQAVLNATNASPIVITTADTTSLHTGDQVTVHGVLGNTNANQTFTISVLSPTTFVLLGSTGNNFYAGGGTWETQAVARFQQPMDGPLWLSLIDGDHTWRQDSRTTTTDLYRFNRAGQGNTVTWEMSGLTPGMYKVEADWATNIFIRNQDLETTITDQATFAVYDGNSQVPVVSRTVDKNQPILDDVVGIDSYVNLGGVTMMGGNKTLNEISINSGTLRVVLSASSGDIMVAGRIRVVPHGNPAGATIIDNSHAISNATNAGPIVITAGSTASLHTGDQVVINGVQGNANANGTFTITVLDATTFSLNGSHGNGNYTSGGNWALVGQPLKYTESSNVLFTWMPAPGENAADLDSGKTPDSLIQALDGLLPPPKLKPDNPFGQTTTST
jgi:hypothetical protein